MVARPNQPMPSTSTPALRARKGMVVPQKPPTMPKGMYVTPKRMVGECAGLLALMDWCHHYRPGGLMGKDGKGVSRRELLTFWRRPLTELREPAPAPPAVTRAPPLRPPGMLQEQLLVEDRKSVV